MPRSAQISRSAAVTVRTRSCLFQSASVGGVRDAGSEPSCCRCKPLPPHRSSPKQRYRMRGSCMDTTAWRGDTSAVTLIDLPDARLFDIRVSGPESAVPFVMHHGTPGSLVAVRAVEDAVRRRGLRMVTYSRAGYGGSARKPGRGRGHRRGLRGVARPRRRRALRDPRLVRRRPARARLGRAVARPRRRGGRGRRKRPLGEGRPGLSGGHGRGQRREVRRRAGRARRAGPGRWRRPPPRCAEPPWRKPSSRCPRNCPRRTGRLWRANRPLTA
jgi:hypothetical protein